MDTLSPLEICWFGALCDDDYEFLGVSDPTLVSSWEHCRDIALLSERAGFDNILLPSGYELGIDTVAFASAIAPLLGRMRVLVAVRCGETWPPQLARQLASLDQILGPDVAGRSRLTINIISSDLPGESLESEVRYRRTAEVMAILRAGFGGDELEHYGSFYDLDIKTSRIASSMDGCPPLYFGGLSDAARTVAAEQADVYLMWPDTLGGVESLISNMRQRATEAGRTLRFGFRVHVVVRETEAEARDAATRLLSRLDDTEGERIRRRSLDSRSVGVARQTELRDGADVDGYVDRHLWTGIGRARSGCGAAIVGDPAQVAATMRHYAEVGIDTFILSGYPHLQEAQRFSDLVMPLLR